MTLALAAAVAVIVLGLAARVVYLLGYRDGHQDGADDLGSEWARAACDAPDAIERAWPAARAVERRPS